MTAFLCRFEWKPRMSRLPEPIFSSRAAKTQRRPFWQRPGFSLASLLLYMMPFCEYENVLDPFSLPELAALQSKRLE